MQGNDWQYVAINMWQRVTNMNNNNKDIFIPLRIPEAPRLLVNVDGRKLEVRVGER